MNRNYIIWFGWMTGLTESSAVNILRNDLTKIYSSPNSAVLIP